MEWNIVLKDGAGRAGARGADAARIVGTVFLLLGPCFLFTAIGIGLSTAHFLEKSLRVDGSVVALRTVDDRDNHSQTYAPVFRFNTPEGRSYTVESHSSSNPPSFSVGETVPVLYDPADPQNAKIDSLWQLWGMVMIFGTLGSVFTTLGGIFLWLLRRQKQREAQQRRTSLI